MANKNHRNNHCPSQVARRRTWDRPIATKPVKAAAAAAKVEPPLHQRGNQMECRGQGPRQGLTPSANPTASRKTSHFPLLPGHFLALGNMSAPQASLKRVAGGPNVSHRSCPRLWQQSLPRSVGNNSTEQTLSTAYMIH